MGGRDGTILAGSGPPEGLPVDQRPDEAESLAGRRRR
jgi:hypothetical protein